jgi:hypothetical protein
MWNFYWIYDLPNWALCTLIIAVFGVFSTLGIRSTRKLARRLMARPHGQNEAVGIYISAIGVFYGITLGLITVGASTTFNDVSAQVDRETTIIASFYRKVSNYPEPTLQSVQTGLPGALWAIVILGALLNIFLTWLLVLDNEQPHLWLGIVSTTMIGIPIFLTAAMDNPFRGEFSVSSDAFQMVYDQLMKVKV